MISITRKDESITWGEIIIGAVKYSANNFISTIYALRQCNAKCRSHNANRGFL